MARDYCSHSGAQFLADRITRYWRERGYDVRVQKECLAWSEDNPGAVMLRSDMVNGMPIRKAAK